MATREVSQVASATQTKRDTEASSPVGQLLKNSGTANILRGELVSSAVSTTGTKISHNLKRQPEGWIVVDMVGNIASVARSAWDTYSITLVASANITVRILIF